MFTNTCRRPLGPDGLSVNFAELLATSGLPPVRLHDLRHGAASLALQAGADLKVVQDQLGHSSIVLTADTYIAVVPEIARKTAEDVARLILSAGRYAPGAHTPPTPPRRTPARPNQHSAWPRPRPVPRRTDTNATGPTMPT
ncbi:tyrosine-type recombinase/integrase [Actinoallomurus soli]|uniref:tyrosine-type recombinase/integrase n=1 Tax=Actinoallomurus soli TaxID=2952535 RepID=UPI002092F7B5|nr:tyrosine-type recombinase/integrase [Actinoallomurus soli]MCO5974141.1 tyrosine-type recombinase/integrase [Actinoallomurus soli]